MQPHGYIGVIGPESNPNYFTGAGYSAILQDAKTFRTPKGCACAMRIWQTADYGKALPDVWWKERRVKPVWLSLVEGRSEHGK